jgi:flagellar hook assembly protein FlgD
LNDPVTLEFNGFVLGAWDGTNAEGDPVGNGNYYVKVDNVDAYGVVTTVTQMATVSRELARIQVNVFNEAGEVVRHITALVDDANGTQLTSVDLSTNVISMGAGDPSEPNEVVATLSTGTTFVWDGRGDSGAVVAGGHYEIEVHWTNGKGAEDVISRGVLVVGGIAGVRGKVQAEPNVLDSSVNFQTKFKINQVTGMTLSVRVYDVAGELVGRNEGPIGGNFVTFDGSGRASGLYLGVVELRDPVTGHFEGRQISKFIIKR